MRRRGRRLRSQNQGETEDEVLAKAVEHAREKVHGVDLTQSLHPRQLRQSLIRDDERGGLREVEHEEVLALAWWARRKGG